MAIVQPERKIVLILSLMSIVCARTMHHVFTFSAVPPCALSAGLPGTISPMGYLGLVHPTCAWVLVHCIGNSFMDHLMDGTPGVPLGEDLCQTTDRTRISVSELQPPENRVGNAPNLIFLPGCRQNPGRAGVVLPATFYEISSVNGPE